MNVHGFCYFSYFSCSTTFYPVTDNRNLGIQLFPHFLALQTTSFKYYLAVVFFCPFLLLLLLSLVFYSSHHRTRLYASTLASFGPSLQNVVNHKSRFDLVIYLLKSFCDLYCRCSYSMVYEWYMNLLNFLQDGVHVHFMGRKSSLLITPAD